jgi:hypothetical protein
VNDWLVPTGVLAIAGWAGDLGPKFIDLLLPEGIESMEAPSGPFLFLFNSLQACAQGGLALLMDENGYGQSDDDDK